MSNGKHLADEVPPGPNNPVWKICLALRDQRLSNCMAQTNVLALACAQAQAAYDLYDEDIEWLYQQVKINTASADC